MQGCSSYGFSMWEVLGLIPNSTKANNNLTAALTLIAIFFCLQLEDCALQVSPSGYYLDPELSLEEQREMLEGFYEEIRSELKGGEAKEPLLFLFRGFDRSGPNPQLCPHQRPAQVSAAETVCSLGCR